jgi:hypothetical protein
MEAKARRGGWQPARLAAAGAGVFLLWRGAFGRGSACLVPLVSGALILRRVFGAAELPGTSSGASRSAKSRPEVIEVKSPAEIEPGVASASPRPTFPDRVERRDPPSAPTQA